jgi:pentatricopeptide repeat protein
VDSRMRVALISALGRAGRMREAMEQLEAMGMGEGGPGWDVFALNAGLAATAVHGEWRVAEAVWRRLIANGVKPDTVSYRCIAMASSLAPSLRPRKKKYSAYP